MGVDLVGFPGRASAHGVGEAIVPLVNSDSSGTLVRAGVDPPHTKFSLVSSFERHSIRFSLLVGRNQRGHAHYSAPRAVAYAGPQLLQSPLAAAVAGGFESNADRVYSADVARARLGEIRSLNVGPTRLVRAWV